MTQHDHQHPTAALSVAQAFARLMAATQPVATVQSCTLQDAVGRVLARDVTAAAHVPAHDNSAMDGYAMRGDDVRHAQARLRLTGTSLAGHPFTGRVAPGECVRIMTGAVLPAGTDTVIMQEKARVDGPDVVFDQAAFAGSNVRLAGEDLAAGQVVLHAGQHLGVAELGLLASMGVAECEVFKRPSVAVFSTGDELRQPGEPLPAGCIYDSNRPVLVALLEELGMDVHDLGVVADTREAVVDALARAARHDAVVTSGGVSVGDADYVVDVLRENGQVGFWKVAVKPGKPLAFGRVDQALFFGLPGNPVSAMVTFLKLVRPALVKLAGGCPATDVSLSVPLTSAISRKPGRREYQRGQLAMTAQGWRVAPVAQQGSGIMRSMSEANCFIVLDADTVDVAAGDTVSVEPFAQPVWGSPEQCGQAAGDQAGQSQHPGDDRQHQENG